MLFPYIGIIKGIDIQPNFLVVVIVMLLIYACNKRISLEMGFFTLILITIVFCFIRYVTQNGLMADSIESIEAMRGMLTSCFHLIVILVCHTVVGARLLPNSPTYIILATLIYVAVGGIQLIDSSFMSSFVYRGYQNLVDGGRGVRSLTSEPAVFGNLLLTLNCLLVYYGVVKKWFLRSLHVTNFTLLSATMLLSMSFYAVFYHLIAIIFFLYLTDRKLFIVSLTILGIVSVLLITTPFSTDLRLLYILKTLIESPVSLYDQGAMLRVLNVPISIIGSIHYGPLGSGFAPSHLVHGTVPFLPSLPYSFTVGDKNMGGLVELFLRLGLLSVPLLYWYFFSLYRVCRLKIILESRITRLGLWFAFVVFLVTFTYSSIGNPIIWLLFFLVYMLRKKAMLSRNIVV